MGVLLSLACALKLPCLTRQRIELVCYFFSRIPLVYPPVFFSLSFCSVNVLMVELAFYIFFSQCKQQAATHVMIFILASG